MSVPPSPLKLCARVLMVSVLVIGLSHMVQRTVVTTMLPIIRATFESVERDFVIISLEIADDGPNEVLRLRANLGGPTNVAGQVFYPIGWGTDQTGGYQITLTTGGVVLYGVLTVIVALSWPASTWRRAATRLMLAVPFALLQIVFSVVLTFRADLWKPIHDEWVPDISWPLLTASRLLMGGSGLVLAVLFGVLIVLMTRTRTATHDPSAKVALIG